MAPRAERPGAAAEIACAASLSALAVALHAVKVPFPLMPALKYDLAGVPVALLALASVRLSLASLVALFVGVLALGGDAVGASMKALAELTTALPLALGRRLLSRPNPRLGGVLSVALATASRTGIMCLANYLVLPRWALAVGWASSPEAARELMVAAMPFVAIFNASLAAPVAALSLGAFRALARAGVRPWASL
ncbi:MAG: hypothetical protein QXU52_03840 [Fervidicoccaceae archaeon]